MSGIYIPNMDMPANCHNCPLGFGGGCYCGTSAEEYMCPDNGRADWCPLVHVPPHGRLIDADALTKILFHYFEKSGGRDALEALIRTEPTIIPTEEE